MNESAEMTMNLPETTQTAVKSTDATVNSAQTLNSTTEPGAVNTEPITPRYVEEGISAAEEFANQANPNENDLSTQPRDPNENKEPDLLKEKTEEAREQLEKLLEKMSDEDKTMLMEYLSSTDGMDNLLIDNDEKINLTDSLAEITRLVAVLLALMIMLITHPDQQTFSGKDLGLSIEPPEREENERLSKLIFGEDEKKSWKSFREAVSELRDLSFGEFMSRVLEANEQNSVRGLKAKEKGQKINPRMKKLLLKFAKNHQQKLATKPAPAPARTTR